MFFCPISSSVRDAVHANRARRKARQHQLGSSQLQQLVAEEHPNDLATLGHVL